MEDFGAALEIRGSDMANFPCGLRVPCVNGSIALSNNLDARLCRCRILQEKTINIHSFRRTVVVNMSDGEFSFPTINSFSNADNSWNISHQRREINFSGHFEQINSTLMLPYQIISGS